MEKLSEKLSERISEIIQATVKDVCDNYCKYRETADENLECDVIRAGKECPLDRLF